MPPVGFEPTISAGERPQTYALDRLTTVPGKCGEVHIEIHVHYVVVTVPVFTEITIAHYFFVGISRT